VVCKTLTYVLLAAKPRDEILITLVDGAVNSGKSWETTPAMVASLISKSVLDNNVIAMVDGELWDLDRPLERSCKLKLLDFSHPEGVYTLQDCSQP
jgi:threonyl-tRNA synthetase